MSSYPPAAATTTDKNEVKDVEKQSKSTKGTDTSALKKLYTFPKWILIIGVVICIVCAITIPLMLRKQDSKQAKAEDNSIVSPSNNNNTSTNFSPSNNNNTSTNSPTNSPTGLTPLNDNDTSTTSPSGSAPLNINNTSTNSLTGTETGSNRTEKSYQNISFGAVTSTLEFFSPDITKGYTNDEDLQSDLFNVFKYVIGVQYNQFAIDSHYSTSFADTVNSSGPASNFSRSDYGTNNQEQGVEEGDILVSDGQYVFAAYGKYLVIWSVSTGTILKTIEMPSANETSWETEESNINSLVLYQGKLLVTSRILSITYEETRILSDYMSTSIRLYDVASLMSSTLLTADAGLVGMKLISGAFSSVRVTNGVAHHVAISRVNLAFSYTYSPYMEDNETVAAYNLRLLQLTEQTSQNITEQLMKELKAGGATPQLTRINLWDEYLYYPDSSSFDPYSGSLLQTLVTINSIDLSSQINGTELNVSSSGSFLRDLSHVYAVANRLILATNVYEYDVNTSASVESVALLAFDLNGASATARSIGRVPGSILNEYYLDVLDDNLRIAVTIQLQSQDTENYVIVMSLPSTTSENPGQMIEQSRVKIGKPQETITAVRFFGTYAYAMTAERKDPFYVIDVSDAANLSVVAELEIPGISTYLHPITADGTRLLAVGESSNDNGFVTGIQLTVFDVSVPSDPKNVSRFVIDAGNGTVYTDSARDFKSSRYYDGYFFLPVALSSYYSDDAVDSFVGTMVFKIDNATGAITEDTQCRIANQQMVDPYSTTEYNGSGNVTEPQCNYYGSIIPRSMVFNGSFMTIQQSDVIMTDLSTCRKLWNFTIGIPNPDGCDSSYWY